MLNTKLKTLIISLVLSTTLLASNTITLTKTELKSAGEKIYLNETGGNPDKLVHWNVGEEFASLGIGHFIWYPEGYNGPFDESFPGLVKYYKDTDLKVPELFNEKYCPWNTLEEFNQNKSNQSVVEAIEFLESTKDIQVAFIYERLQKSLDKMLEVTDNKDHVREQFYMVAQSKGGLYPLIDYVNFKGEGVKDSERYNEYGWGLLQILENMQATKVGDESLYEFRKNAKFVLQRRVDNAPKSRGEDRWIPGWNKRIDTYK